ncbi:MAG: glycoside hydrolase family 88 protein [Planctomycetota bacterium]
MPESHLQWQGLFAVYKDFAAAVLKSQDETGLWHQLITRHDSFQETSGMLAALIRVSRAGNLRDVTPPASPSPPQSPRLGGE